MQARTLAALALFSSLPLAAQQINDPANLMGERVSAPALADTLPINHGAAALEQLLRKLRTRASLMLIVAHPDDEDGGMLTFESRGEGARVAMLTLNRGEGGQNLMSADFNDALGLIRTQELLAEDRYTGTDQFFGTEVDFGFSKTKEEAFRKWTHDRVLYDAVRAVRLYRPLVLASVFIGEPTDGHGQHQVSGEIAQEVFLAAADPNVFPEMGLPPWAPLKVYARVPFAQIDSQGMYDYATGKVLPPRFENYVTGQVSTTPPAATVIIHEGTKPDIPAFNGLSYVQFARQGLALQKSQIGPNVRIPPAGVVDVGYTLYGSRVPCPAGTPTILKSPGAPSQPKVEAGTDASNSDACPMHREALSESDATQSSLFEGIDSSLTGLATLTPDASPAVKAVIKANLNALDQSIQQAQQAFDPTHPEASAPILRDAFIGFLSFLRNVENIQPQFLPPDQKLNLLHELRIKRVQLNDALVLALGVDASVKLADSAPVTRESQADFAANVSFGPTPDVHLTAAALQFHDEFHSAQSAVQVHDDPRHFIATLAIPADAVYTQPYFTRASLEEPVYRIANSALRNAPGTPAPLEAVLQFNYEGADLELHRTVAEATAAQAAAVVPTVSLAAAPRLSIASGYTTQLPFKLTLTSNRAESGNLHATNPPAWSVSIRPDTYQFAGAGEKAFFSGTIQPNSLPSSIGVKLQFAAADPALAPRDVREGYRPVGYAGLTTTNLYEKAEIRVVGVNVTTAPNLRIAYLPGTGDDVPTYLPNLGVTPAILTPQDLTLNNLKQYDAILLGVRVYAAHPELQGTGSDPLRRYAEQGGIVIAQYDSGGFNPASAPFPYTLPGDPAHNVVEEEQPVQIIAPDNPLLTWPNRITSADFNGWIEERGHGFASDWAPAYTPLLEAHDEGQAPQRGGLLLARTGKGAWIYCAFALYRQLPEGVPGAWRLTANLLSYAKNPHR